MPRISEIEDAKVVAADGSALGTIAEVLFHPSEPRVVGFLVHPPKVGGVVKLLKPRFVPFPSAHEVIAGKAIRADVDKLMRDRQAKKELGFDYHTTVVWRGMPVNDPHGEREGWVKDVGFGRRKGTVRSLVISSGPTKDVAVGATVIDGSHVKGFDGAAVVVTVEGLDAGELAGGAAQLAGAASAYAKVHGERIVDKANKAVSESKAAKAAAKAYDPDKVGRSIGKLIGGTRKAALKGLEDFEKRQDDDD